MTKQVDETVNGESVDDAVDMRNSEIAGETEVAEESAPAVSESDTDAAQAEVSVSVADEPATAATDSVDASPGPVADTKADGAVNEERTDETVVEADDKGDAAAEADADTEAATNETEQDAGAEADAEESFVADAVTADDSDEDGDDQSEDGDSKRVVRMLSVGQQVDGVVRRITDFGAFVDIGVGRDGLIHISELSLRRVGKVSDVLSANQEIRPWIKKLDRKRNRISLTLIDPEMKTIRDLKEGEILEGTVTRIVPYGAFIDIGIGRDALLHVREMSNKYVEKPEDIVSVGETFETRIIEVSRRRNRVDLSLKGLRDEPEEEQDEEVTIDEEIEEIEDDFEDVEVLSTMELAFKRAVEAEGEEIQVEKKRGKKARRQDSRAIQDEIIARTLESGRK